LEKTGFNLDDRVLCSDDACIGLIGPDGKCKVCGLEYTGNEPLPSPDGELRPSVETAAEPSSESSSELKASASDPGERVCCTDEACIGIIGADGNCGTCGKPG
jgi:hypothetical protein